MNHANSGLLGQIRLALPRLDDVREKAVTRTRVLGQYLLTAIAVVADRRTGHEYAWKWIQRGEGLD